MAGRWVASASSRTKPEADADSDPVNNFGSAAFSLKQKENRDEQG
jgi:hypothetical protein